MEQAVWLPTRADSARLDAAIAQLKTQSKGPDVSLLIEHLETAHAYLHGGMPFECAVNLELARNAVKNVSDRGLRSECRSLVAELLERLNTTSPKVHDALQQRIPPATAAQLAAYFHGTGVSLGNFYPNKHLIAVLPTFEVASTAGQRLSGEGFSHKRVLAASGEEMERFLSELRAGRGIGAVVMTQVSRILDAGAGLTDHYVEWARGGCGFVVAFSPDEGTAVRMSVLFGKFGPLAAHWYATGSIHSLI